MLEDAARGCIRDLHGFYFGFSDQVQFDLSRQGSNDDRARSAFFQIMSEYFQERCGGKLYYVIAALSGDRVP